jgi:hypothetical protein
MDEAHGRMKDQHAPLIQVSTMGNLGNRMIQYMAVLALAARVPGARLGRIHLPEWGIQIGPVAEEPGCEIVTSSVIPLDGLAARLNAGTLSGVDIRTYAQRVENFLPAEAYRTAFPNPSAPNPSARPAGPGELLCNIRQGDILDAHHADYVLLPIDFYADLAACTGLAPVFMGQLEDTPYLQALRRRFPGARYVPSQGAVADFAFIRACTHIVPAISTFSWLAAWLSEAETVHLAAIGLFNPRQAPDTNLLPLDDPRYRFTWFPHHYAVPVAQVETAHATIRHLWRAVPPDTLRALLARPPPPRDAGAHFAAFDEAYYLNEHPDIAETVAAGHMPSGRHHFEHYGFYEGRTPFALDAAWYVTQYPIAAIEMGQGDARDPIDHWVRVGRERGYGRLKEGR